MVSTSTGIHSEASFGSSTAATLPAVEVRYADHEIRPRQCITAELLEQQLEFWRERLSGAPEMLHLPTDRPRPSIRCYSVDRVPLFLPAELTERLRKLALAQGTTLFVTLLTSWALLLGRWSGQEEVVIGTWVANRLRPENEPPNGAVEIATAVRVRAQEGTTVQQILQQVQAEIAEVRAHQDVPFEQIAEKLKAAGRRGPVLQAVMRLNCTTQGAIGTHVWREMPDLTVSEMPIENEEETPFELSLSLSDEDRQITGALEYARDLFEPNTIEAMVSCWKVILEGMLTNDRQKVRQLQMLTIDGRREVVHDFNAATVAFPADRLVHELFEEQVERTPDVIAVVCGGERRTYAEINTKADQLARYLIHKGAGPDQLVALCVERSIEMLVGLLGILKSGGAYVPVDPNLPTERLTHVLRDAAPRLLLTQKGVAITLPPTTAEVVALDGDWEAIVAEGSANCISCPPPQSSGNLAYVIYTSGSTGVPKGVMVEHSGVVNFLISMKRQPGIRSADCMLSVTTMSFDIAALEIYLPLIAGAKLVIASREAGADAQRLMGMLDEFDVSVMQATPATWQMLLSGGWKGRSSLKALCGGEALTTELARSLAARVGALWNLYGPTETTIWSSAREIQRADERGPIESIGRPIANTQIYILDQYGELAPVAMMGEIYIGGAGVARGYLNRPELTAERFLPNPFSLDPRARMYKTGDLGRWRSDGTIDYVGRNDHQVKMRGFRIELGEIEARLVRHERVSDAVVTVREDVAGEKRLVAYVVPCEPSEGRAGPNVKTLRMYLKTMLPEYMVPSAFVVLDRFPLTPNGKVDRRALPSPDLEAYASREYEAPEGEMETLLAEIWQKLLRVERVGRQDNFFELGGHSLLIVQMLEQLRQAGRSTEVRRVFESRTLADLAAALTCEMTGNFAVLPNLIQKNCETITPQMLSLVELDIEHIEQIVRLVPGGAPNIQDIYPLTPLQEGIFFHHLLNGQAGGAYVKPVLLALSSRTKLDEFVRALQEVIDRHDILRTAVLWERLPQPLQVVYRKATLPVEELTLGRDCIPLERLEELMRPERQILDLRQAPLMQLQIAPDLGRSQWYALLQAHHLVFDDESLETMLGEVVAHIEGHAQGLPEPVPYRNHVAQALTLARSQNAEQFFRNKLGEIDEPTAPFGLSDVHGDGSRVEEAHKSLEPTLAQRIRARARRLGVSAATIFHAAWGLVLARTSGRDDVVYGTVLLGRLHGNAGAQRTLGMFINTLPLCLRLQSVTAGELVEQTKRELVDLLNHEQTPLSIAQRCSGISGSVPLFSALLNYLHGAPASETGQSWLTSGIQVLASRERTNYPIVLSVSDQSEGFVLSAQTDRRVDPQRILEYMSTALQSLARALEQTPHIPALALAILPEGERRQVVELFNEPQASYPQEKLIQDLFEAQVRWSPGATAVVCEGQALTYAELNGKANQLAWYLREKGVRPDQLVGICLERGLDLVVGLLGILKAGGAYVPLDPTYPAERVAYMLNDAAPKVLLIQEKLRGRLPAVQTEVIALDSQWHEIAGHSTRNPDSEVLGMTSSRLAYVIYTSGSTGAPKGVMVEHRNVTRLFAATQKWFEFNEHDVWTLFHSVAFDFSVWELWGALLYGGRVVVVPYLTARSPQEFYRLLCAEGVTVLNQTPSAFAQLIEAQAQSAQAHSLRVVIFGGEALELHTLRPWVRRNGAERPQLVNMYGITETTVHVTYRLLTEEEVESERGSQIGKPITDLRVYLLDRNRQPVPIGVVGEIYVGGAGVARGYLNRAELTAQRFLADPFSADPPAGDSLAPAGGSLADRSVASRSVTQARVYRSGDLGRWRTDGTIEYLGRNDQQVKIRGFRIELGEIEAQLLQHSQVKEAVVIAREDVPGERRLVAYVIPGDLSGAEAVPSAQSLRAHLKAVLPEHMVPGAFVILERFALTSNGKLDRAALPVPDEQAVPMRQYVAPRNELERKLCEIWSQVLGLERIGIEDNFFAIGGDSILSLRVLTRAQALGVTFGVADLFQNQSIGQLARAIEAGGRGISPWKKIAAFELLSPEERAQFAGVNDIADAYPLSLLQEGMYFHSEVAPESAVYHDVFSYCIEAAFHREHFEHAVHSLVERHPVLRTGFVMGCEHRLVQIVHKRVAVGVQVEDISQLSPREQDCYIREWIGREKHQEFVWSEPPLLRIFVHVRGQNRFQYNLSFHHAILDGWSVASLQTELMSHYSHLLASRQWTVEAPKVMYRDYIARERQALQSAHSQEYWRGLLEGASLPSLPQSSDTRGKHKGQEVDAYAMSFEPRMGRGLEMRAQQLGVHLKLLLLAAHVKVMSVICGEHTVLTGMVAHGRFEEEDGERVLGLHLNSLPVRVEVRAGSWRELVMQLRDLEEAMLPHRYYPLAAIQELMHSEKLIDTLFNFTRFHVYKQIEAAVKVSEAEGFEQTNFSLLVNFSQELSGSGISVSISFDPAVLDRIQVERISGYYECALRRIVDDIDACHHEEALLSEMETDELLVQFNRTASSSASDCLIHELFEEQVKRTPNAVAVVHEQRSLTYAQLNGKANQLARYLLNQGVGPDQLVGICVARGLEMVVGLLGILKAGGAYVPLDPNYPAERLRHMLEDAAPRVVLTQEELKSALPVTQAEVIALDSKLKEIAGYIAEDLAATELGLTAQNLVYVIYTSGSTGRPKGTAMAHGSMVNLIAWHRKLFCASEGLRVLQFAALSFDVAFQETFSTLCSGGALVMLDEWVRRDARALMELLSNQSIERIFVPPLMLQSLAESFKTANAVPQSLRDVITAGEQLRISPEIVNLFEHLDGCRLHNHYGPTETHVVTALTLAGSPDEWPALPSIGVPIANTRIYVLDEHRQPVPLGVLGEIYIGGAGVAQGYRGKPQLTAQRFLPDPFSPDLQGRMYKTGDLGRWRADATLEYLGRNDDQVKIRGFRVELGEIEAQLTRLEQVKEAAIIACEVVPGEKRLVAYVVCRDTQEVASVETLRMHLKAVLPEHMVPSAFVILESLPLTPNGKLDRRALPAPELEAYASRHYEAPQGEVEEILAGIWQALLRVERVGRQDSFFELGGHSLLMVQMMARLRHVGLSADVRSIYMSPTLADLARALTGGTARELVVAPNLIPPNCETITPQMLPLVELESEHIERIVQAVPGGARNIQDIYPLVALQEGILFHHLLNEKGGDPYGRPMLLSLPSRERLEELIRALQKMIDRHDILRTAVLWEQLPRPVQVVYRQFALPVQQVTLDPDRDATEQVKEWMKSDHLRLDLRQPLMRLQIAADTHGLQWYALLQTHHLICDNESLQVLLAEVMACFAGRAHELPESVAYRNHVAQVLAHAKSHDAEAFFRRKLGEIDEPTAPFGVLDVQGDGSQLEAVRQPVELALARRIRQQARRSSVTAATLFHTVWALVVARTSGRDDVVFGSVLLGRLQGNAGAQRILGMFINTLPLRLHLQGVTAKELVEQTQRELVELLTHEQASLAVAQRCSGVAGSAPLFSTLLNYLHGPSYSETEQPLMAAGIQVLASQGGTNYPIALSVYDQGEAFELSVQTDRRIDPQRMLGYVFTAMHSLVEALEQLPQTPALTLSILPQCERHQVIELFNATQAAYPHEKLIHELFEEQVQRTPDATAVIYDGQSLTYAELNARANQLAWHLRSKGIGPDQLVGVCVERSLDMVVALLGSLKAGGAYVPLDPSYPAERLSYMLKDSRPGVLLTQERVKERLPAMSAELIVLDDAWQEIAKQTRSNMDIGTSGLIPGHLAYVIYTSGSTGDPKGVMVEHRSVLNLWQGLEHLYCQSTPCQRVALNSSLNFDASLQQFAQLLSGRTLIVLSQECRRDPALLLRTMDQQRIDGIDCTPSQLRSWIAAGLLHNRKHGLRAVLVGGEEIDAQLWGSLTECPEIQFFNVYGPTECTVDATSAHLQRDGKSPHIGHPMQNRRAYILNARRQIVPIGGVGELYIGGEGIARGYLNRPELTADRFLPDPFSHNLQARMYRTGDMARWRADGEIEYMGRNDFQVKVRGYRIELGEIESQLVRHEHVKDAVVIARTEAPGKSRLVAYVTTHDGTATVQELRRHLGAVLPEYMIPSAFVLLERLPLTVNGKLDRHALPVPESGAYATRHYEAPQGELEEMLAEIWQELLQVERVGRQDNYFELGGHSISAMQVLSRVRSALSVEMPMRFLFKFPTIEQLSPQLSDLRQASLLRGIETGADEMEELIKTVASMPENRVQELVRELRGKAT